MLPELAVWVMDDSCSDAPTAPMLTGTTICVSPPLSMLSAMYEPDAA
jgi:hypothetical protein